jgi:hypothetical protein
MKGEEKTHETVESASYLVKRMFLENHIGLLIGAKSSSSGSKFKSKKSHRHRHLKLQLNGIKGDFNKLNASSGSVSSTASTSSSTSSSRSGRNEEKLDKSSTSAVTGKTPKSALLERRRKAVFELLTHEIYPSGKLAIN